MDGFEEAHSQVFDVVLKSSNFEAFVCISEFLTNLGEFVIVLKTLFWNICSFMDEFVQAYVINGRSTCL